MFAWGLPPPPWPAKWLINVIYATVHVPCPHTLPYICEKNALTILYRCMTCITVPLGSLKNIARRAKSGVVFCLSCAGHCPLIRYFLHLLPVRSQISFSQVFMTTPPHSNSDLRPLGLSLCSHLEDFFIVIFRFAAPVCGFWSPLCLCFCVCVFVVWVSVCFPSAERCPFIAV